MNPLTPVSLAGLPHILALWRSVLTLLQSEDQAVRDMASETVTAALSQENTHQATGAPMPAPAGLWAEEAGLCRIQMTMGGQADSLGSTGLCAHIWGVWGPTARRLGTAGLLWGW